MSWPFGRKKGLEKNERLDAIIKFLARKRCATIDEILKEIEPVNKKSNSKDPKAQTYITLSIMKKRGLISRQWITIGARKKRLYCLKV